MPDRFHINRSKMSELPSLDRWGVAIEEFPAFVPPENRLLHTHDCVEMVFVRKGKGGSQTGRRQLPVQTGNARHPPANSHFEKTREAEGIDWTEEGETTPRTFKSKNQNENCCRYTAWRPKIRLQTWLQHFQP